MPSRRWLRSASTDQLLVPSYRRSTIGRRAFPIAGARIWNSLPSDVTSAPSLAVFGWRLKTELFRRCYNAAWLLTFFPLIVVLEMDFLFRPYSKYFVWWWWWWWWCVRQRRRHLDAHWRGVRRHGVHLSACSWKAWSMPRRSRSTLPSGWWYTSTAPLCGDYYYCRFERHFLSTRVKSRDEHFSAYTFSLHSRLRT